MTVENYRHIVEKPSFQRYCYPGRRRNRRYVCINRQGPDKQRQIHKHRTRLGKRFREGAFKNDSPIFSEHIETEDYEPRVVRTKRFALKPMIIDEAILQMDLLGHSFFVFRNAETDEINVLYKRKDGNYGLIEPDYM